MACNHDSGHLTAAFEPLPAPATTSSITHPAVRPARAPLWQPDDLGEPGREGPAKLVTALARTILEALTGRRPLAQLSGWLAQDAHAVVMALARVRRWDSVRLRGVRARMPQHGVIEGVILFEIDGRVIAGSTRLQRQQDRWVCTHFRLLECAAATQAPRAA